MNRNISQFGLAMTAEQYSDQWALNSSDMERDGCYDWMAERLGAAPCILDIGSGSGQGLVSLVKGRSRIVCLESNESLLLRAESRLNEAGITSAQCAPNQITSFLTETANVVLLVKADVLESVLDTSLPTNAFDAVTCWQIGTYPAHIEATLGVPISQHTVRHGPEYRVRIHTRCRDIAAQALRRGGAFQVVDRCLMSNWSHKSAFRSNVLQDQRDFLGEQFSIELSDVLFRKMDAGLNSSGIQHVHDRPSGTEGVPVHRSILARRL